MTTWIFDVDGTLIDSQSGTVLRPLASELLAALVDRGDRVVLWSAGGAEYARRRAAQHELSHLVIATHDKTRRHASDPWDVAELARDHADRVFVDDEPGPIPVTERVIRVRPYIGGSPHDRGLLVVADLEGIDLAL